MFQTHSYSMTRKSHYINNTKMLLMLASTIRFSNHYQTPPTSSHEPVTTTWQVGRSAETTPNTVGRCDSRTQQRAGSSPPDNPRRQGTYPDHAGWMSERSDVPPMRTQHHHERVINWGSD